MQEMENTYPKVTSARRAENLKSTVNVTIPQEGISKKEMVKIVDNSERYQTSYAVGNGSRAELVPQTEPKKEMVKIVDNSERYQTGYAVGNVLRAELVPQTEPKKEMVKIVDNSERYQTGYAVGNVLRAELVPQTEPKKEMVKIVDKHTGVTDTEAINMEVFKIAGMISNICLSENQDQMLLPIPCTNVKMAIGQVVEGENPRYKCLVVVNEGELREIIIPVARFNDGRWLKDIPCVGIAGGAKAMGTISEYLNKYVMNYNGAVTREIMKPGWTEWNGHLYYVTPKGVLSRNSAPVYSMYGQEFPQLTGTECVGSVSEFLELGRLTPNNPASIIISLYTIIGFLYSFFKSAGVPVKFSLFLHGKRGSMKTSLALAMTQIEDRKNPKYTLRATSAGLEAGFRRYKDAIMLIDDLSPTRDAAEQRTLLHNLELVVRCFGDGTGKKRNNDYVTDNSKVMQYEAEGGAIITGEYVAGVESSLARSLFLPLGEGDVDIEFLSRIQEDNNRLARFLVGFFSYLEEKPQYYISLIARWCKSYRESRQGQYSNHRYAEYYADLMTASELLLRYGCDSGQIDDNQARFYHDIHQRAIDEVIDINNWNLNPHARTLGTTINETMQAIGY